MGLDMYLTAERYLWTFPEDNPDIAISKAVGELLPRPNNERVKAIRVEAAYWRKANQIHKWFVDNIQDGVDECNPHYVSFDDLESLVSLCKKLIELKEIDLGRAVELAKTSLPTKSGFFFGDTSYDEFYWKDLQGTVDMIQPWLKKTNDGKYVYGDYEFEYRSSW